MEEMSERERQRKYADLGYIFGWPMLGDEELTNSVQKLHKWYMGVSNCGIAEKQFGVTFNYKKESDYGGGSITERQFVTVKYGKQFDSRGGIVFLGPYEFFDLFRFRAMDINLLKCYELNLCKTCEYNKQNHVAILEPVLLTKDNKFESHDENVEGYITNALRKFKRKAYIMIPFHERSHWILIVIVPACGEVWYLNSIRCFKTSEGVSQLINRAWKKNNDVELVHKLEFQCRQQGSGDACGFYVCYHMRLLVEHTDTSNAVLIPEDELTYNERNDVREELCYFIHGIATQ